MKKVTNKPKTAEEEYPELNEIAKYIELCSLSLIHKEKIKLLRNKGTTCPYPAQCLLEMLIKRLEESV